MEQQMSIPPPPPPSPQIKDEAAQNPNAPLMLTLDWGRGVPIFHRLQSSKE